MGSYTFTWEHDATEVFVTGTFDDWKKTVQLEKKDGIFQKTVELPKTKTQYKFVVDGNWCTNDTAPKEDDGKGIVNNVLTPDDIKEPAAGAATISSAAPESTTAALASQVPKESDKPKSEESLPGAFPLTPPTETPSTEPQLFSVNPIPATDTPGNPIKLAPGEPVPDPSTLTSNTVQSTVKDDKEPEKEQTFGVAPIPAGETAGNPIKLAPGEPVPDPSTLTSNTVDSTVKTDAASYEKSDALPPQLGPVVTPEAERAANGGMFGLPPLTGPLIPESSLPKDVAAKTEQDPGVTIQSAAPTSTTAALAGQVPLESAAVPEAVKASQEEAGFTPEASANPEAVEEKKEVEQELKDKVPEQPAATESSTNTNVTETVAAGATAAAGAFAAATYAAKDKAAETIGLNGQATASDVPAVVAESQKEAHVSPEAAANPEAVEEKKQVEAELIQEVSKAGETTETAASEVPAVVAESQKEAHVSPEAAANPVAVEEKKEVEAELVKEVNKAGETTVADVPAVVTESQQKADASPEATLNAEAVEEKKEVETELLKEVKKTDEAAEPAPVVTAATTETAPATASSGDALNAPAAAPAQPETSKPAADSRDVSPMSKPATKEQTQPTVTTGAETSKTEAKSTPETTAESSKGQEESVASSAAADKKKKRRSFFGKLKDKLSSKS